MNTSSRPVLTRGISSLLALTVLSSNAAAAVAWVGNISGDINDGSNWSGAPAGQDLYIGIVGNQSGPAPFTATLSSNLAYTIVDLQVARGGGPAVFNHTAGTAATGGGNWLDVGTDGGTGTYNLADVNTAGGTLTGFGQGAGSITANQIHVGGVDYSGNGGTGTMRVNTTGTVQTNHRFYVGNRGNGTFLLDSGTVNVGNDMEVGSRSGVGVMSMSGGTVNAGTGGGWQFVGRDREGNAGADGTLNISGGVFNNNFQTNRFYIGENNATGKVNVSGGTLQNQNGDMLVGNANNAAAVASSLNISGTGSVMAANVFFGNGGKGNLNMTGGTFSSGLTSFGNGGTSNSSVSGGNLTATGEIRVGQGAGGNGTLAVSGGTVQSNAWIAIGREGATGNLNLSGNGIVKKTGGNGSHIIIGSLDGNGTVTQTGGQLLTEGGDDIYLGENSNTGKWDISAGSGSAIALRIGAIGAGNGIVNLSGTGQLTFDEVDVGQANGNGTLNITGGNLINDHLQVGTTARGNTGKGVINQSAGTVNTARWIAVGLGSTQQSEFHVSGGIVNGGGLEAGADSAGLVTLSGTGQINIGNGFGNRVEVPTRNGSGIFNITGGTLNAGDLLQGGRDGSVGTGVTTQSGGQVNLTGNLDVQRPSVGTGTYNLSGGILSVNGTIDLNGGNFVFTGGKITRSNAGIIDIDGNLTTGAMAATLKLDANKTFDVSGVLDTTQGLTLDLTGLGLSDQPGNFTAPATGSFPLGVLGATASPVGDAFDLAFTTVSGFDATFNVAGLGDFTASRINQGDAFNSATQSVYWVNESAGAVTLEYSVVPEPAAIGLLMMSGLGFLARRRRSV